MPETERGRESAVVAVTEVMKGSVVGRDQEAGTGPQSRSLGWNIVRCQRRKRERERPTGRRYRGTGEQKKT